MKNHEGRDFAFEKSFVLKFVKCFQSEFEHLNQTMIAMKLWEVMRKSLLSVLVVATVGICMFGADVTEARYLPTRGKSDGLDRLRDLLRDVSVVEKCLRSFGCVYERK